MKTKYLKDYKWIEWGKYLKSKGSSLSLKSKKISFGISSGRKRIAKNLGNFIKKTLAELNSKIGTSFSFKKKLSQSSIKIFASKTRWSFNKTLGYTEQRDLAVKSAKLNLRYMKKPLSQFKETLLHEMGHALD